jgi:hypothetical protein
MPRIVTEPVAFISAGALVNAASRNPEPIRPARVRDDRHREDLPRERSLLDVLVRKLRYFVRVEAWGWW